MNAIGTACTVFQVLQKWPDDGQLTKTCRQNKKIKDIVVLLKLDTILLVLECK
jgi:hypothetical protein